MIDLLIGWQKSFRPSVLAAFINANYKEYGNQHLINIIDVVMGCQKSFRSSVPLPMQITESTVINI